MPKCLNHMHSGSSYSKNKGKLPKMATHYYWLSFVVTLLLVFTRFHSFSLDVSLVCLFVNDLDIVENSGKTIQL